MNVASLELCKELYELSGTEWRPVVGIEDRFLVSELGDIQSMPSRTGKGRVRKIHQRPDGYCYVNYLRDGMHTNLSVHRAVAEAFIDNPNSKASVNHIDSNPGNNHRSNLEWATFAENVEHSRTYGKADRYQNRGERHGMHKLTLSQVVNVKHCRGAISGIKLAKLYGVGAQTIYDIWNGRRWKHVA